MQTKTYQIKGMHCASCAGIIEKTFKKTKGVHSAEVNYGTETAKVSFDELTITPHHLSQTVEPLGYSLLIPTTEEMSMPTNEHTEHLGLTQSKKDKLAEIAALRTTVITSIRLALIAIFIMGWDILGQLNYISPPNETISEFFHHLLPILATYMLFVAGKPYLLGFYRFLRYGKANMDTLIGIGTSAAFLYSFIISAFENNLSPYINVEHSYYDVTIVVIAFITLGKYLEARSKIKTGDAIEKLLNLQVKTALVIRDEKEIEIPIQDVKHGDVIVIKPGAKIPVDGIVIHGNSFVDESMVTGEPMPAQKNTGASVVAGTINTTGSFTFKTTKIGSETMLAQIIKMVSEAQGSKAPIQALADKISSVFVPSVLFISFLALAAWLLFGTGPLGFSQALSYGLVSFVGVLVIACPCALGLATPTAIIVGVGKGAKEGILIRDAATLEKLHKINTLVIDKTGTITLGKPTLVDIQNQTDISDAELISILTSLEQKSEHPIARAITNYAQEKNITIKDINDFESISGKGIAGVLDGKKYYAGNIKLIQDLGLMFDPLKIERFTIQGKTPIIIATKEKILGFITVSDEIKPTAKQAVNDLHRLGIKVIMLTGDEEKTAAYIASLVGIDQVAAHLLPQDKLTKIKELQSQHNIVAMAGDGINDAPALAQADIGIAMGNGTDIAIESAGITLLGGDISKLVKAVKLSKITMRGIKQNLFWAFIYNIVGIPLAAGLFYPIFGWLLNPIFAGLAMAFSSVSVVANSLRIKTKKI
ncbi:MAG: copper-translocating P-type ATPase [Candidatus Magasanikbacteria bacterium]|nr:copper-translocating P-type ATPase [Candidatus Magasanikbacteria bacterium]